MKRTAVVVKGHRYAVRDAGCMGRNCLEVGLARRDGNARNEAGCREGDPVCSYWDLAGCPEPARADVDVRRRMRETGGWRFEEGAR
jgi:hypothetical protein